MPDQEKTTRNHYTLYATIHDLLDAYKQDVDVMIIIGVLEAVKLDMIANQMLTILAERSDDDNDDNN